MPGRTRLRFTQDYAVELSDDDYGIYNFNWGYYLESLRLLATAGPGSPSTRRRRPPRPELPGTPGYRRWFFSAPRSGCGKPAIMDGPLGRTPDGYPGGLKRRSS